MEFHYSRAGLKGAERMLERFFEILPAAASWTIIAGMILLSFFYPIAAAIIIIAFYIYWIMRLFYLNIFLVISYVRLSIERKTDWMKRIRELDDLITGGVPPRYEPGSAEARTGLSDEAGCGVSWQERVSHFIYRRQAQELLRSRDLPAVSAQLRHVVILPIVREGRDIVEPAIKSLAGGSFPSERMLLVLALEELADDRVKDAVIALSRLYRHDFLDVLTTLHPSGIEGEARVKGANVSCAARTAAQYLKERNIPFENVIVSCFDADTVAHRDYFSCLTYSFMVASRRQQASFQPIPVYHNNIWDAPGFARVLDVGASFFQLIEATNPEKLVTFSSHSMSFAALVDVGYWPVDIVSDDSAIFWKAFIHYDGNYRVVPMYITLSMNVAVADTWWKTLANVYKQKRRWAWGVENFPLVMRAFLRARSISLYKKVIHGFKLFEGHVSWASWPLLLTVVGWLPAFFAGREFTRTTMYYSAPRITITIFRLASVGLAVCIILSLLLLPGKNVRFTLRRKALHAFEWLLVPLVSIFLTALPALDAQTRLMLGRYMEFWVTAKKRR